MTRSSPIRWSCARRRARSATWTPTTTWPGSVRSRPSPSTDSGSERRSDARRGSTHPPATIRAATPGGPDHDPAHLRAFEEEGHHLDHPAHHHCGSHGTDHHQDRVHLSVREQRMKLSRTRRSGRSTGPGPTSGGDRATGKAETMASWSTKATAAAVTMRRRRRTTRRPGPGARSRPPGRPTPTPWRSGTERTRAKARIDATSRCSAEPSSPRRPPLLETGDRDVGRLPGLPDRDRNPLRCQTVAQSLPFHDPDPPAKGSGLIRSAASGPARHRSRSPRHRSPSAASSA